MGTYYENNETLLRRNAWLFIGDEALRIATAEGFGEVEFSEYLEVYKMRVRLTALQTETLDTAGEEPILASIAAVVNTFPAKSQVVSEP